MRQNSSFFGLFYSVLLWTFLALAGSLQFFRDLFMDGVFLGMGFGLYIAITSRRGLSLAILLVFLFCSLGGLFGFILSRLIVDLGFGTVAVVLTGVGLGAVNGVFFVMVNRFIGKSNQQL